MEKAGRTYVPFRPFLVGFHEAAHLLRRDKFFNQRADIASGHARMTRQDNNRISHAANPSKPLMFLLSMIAPEAQAPS